MAGQKPNWRQAGINVMDLIQTLILEDQKHKKKMTEIQADFDNIMKKRKAIDDAAFKRGELSSLTRQLEITMEGILDMNVPAAAKQDILAPQYEFLQNQINALKMPMEEGRPLTAGVSPESVTAGVQKPPVTERKMAPMAPDFMQNIEGLFKVTPEPIRRTAGEKTGIARTKGGLKGGIVTLKDFLGTRQSVETYSKKRGVDYYTGAYLASLDIYGKDPREYPEVIPSIEKWWEPAVKALVEEAVAKEIKDKKLTKRKVRRMGYRNLQEFAEKKLRPLAEKQIRANKPKFW